MRIAPLATILAALPLSAVAQDALPACAGDFTVVRLIQIKPGGSMQGFLAAVDAHRAWYRTHGFTDNSIVVSRVITRDPITGVAKYSDTEVLTYHFRPPGMGNPPGRGDAAWKAYVKRYQETSAIKSEYVTCMPRRER
jgi:hypothetical protein